MANSIYGEQNTMWVDNTACDPEDRLYYATVTVDVQYSALAVCYFRFTLHNFDMFSLSSGTHCLILLS